MSLLIQRSEQFRFNGLNIRSCYLKEHGQCLIAKDVYRALGYTREAGKQAIRRLVPAEYKLRVKDTKIEMGEAGQYGPASPRLSFTDRSGSLLLPIAE